MHFYLFFKKIISRDIFARRSETFMLKMSKKKWETQGSSADIFRYIDTSSKMNILQSPLQILWEKTCKLFKSIFTVGHSYRNLKKNCGNL